MNTEIRNTLKYMKIYNHFKTLILNGVLTKDDKLPTESELVSAFDVSRITVIKAMNMLTADGYVYRIQGGGTFVASREEGLRAGSGVEFISLITSCSPQGREIELIHSIESKIKQSGYLLSVSSSNDDPELELQLVREMREKAKGIILYLARSNRNVDLFYDLFQARYPIVYVDKFPFNVPGSYVVSDNIDGGYQLGHRLVELGHRRIGLVFHRITEFTSETHRVDGFMKAMSEAGIPRSDISLFSVQEKGADDEMQRLFAALAFQPEEGGITALFVCNGVVLHTIAEYMNEKRIVLPEHFIFATFDSIYPAASPFPLLTAEQDFNEIGAASASLILRQIHSPDFFDEHVSIPVRIVDPTASKT